MDDAGLIVGVAAEALDTVEQWVVNVASNNCDPPIRPTIRKYRLKTGTGNEVPVVGVIVKKGLYVHRTTSGRFVMRVGSTVRDLTSQELARLLQHRGRAFIFDEQPVPDAGLEEIDTDRVWAAITPSEELSRGELLDNLRVTLRTDSEHSPTVAGLLAFGKRPEKFLPGARIAAAVYRGVALTSNELVHSDEIGGTVDAQIAYAMGFVGRWMRRSARKHMGREDLPQFDLDAVHEAIVNAVAHRDYSQAGARIRLFIFADRLELYSPGGLPNTVTLETLPFRTFTRNQLLVSFMSRLKNRLTGRGLIESRGEGVRSILKRSEELSGRRPEYRLLGPELLLTVWGAPPPTDELSEALT